ncbi:Uncharacterised protein [BD1-7 clade bacterium]|uniref:Lipoprotein n=1 Tax=BD1-7 clade bacterium TaxID=2029982 RepID=A0A5S9QKU5_9GAMM|nr:Uncharacterised protein [BD1-7 clade bacterium]
MKLTDKKSLSGAAIAIAAASITACSDNPTNDSADSATTDLAHCYGVNACKGHNDCKTAEHSCAGQATCKGSGSFVIMPTEACNNVGGQVKDDWRSSVATASLIQCYDVNLCKGQNDCATATNACKGQASCKGTGWVAMPTKACTDIGGKTKGK